MYRPIFLVAALTHLVGAQQPGTLVQEIPPPLMWKNCLTGSGCQNVAGKVTLDANLRWTHLRNSPTDCFSSQGNTWNYAVCFNNDVCAQNCEIEGAQYAAQFGTTTNQNSININLRTQHGSGTNIGARVFLLDTNTAYKKFNMINKEIRVDVDVSTLPCGAKASFYFVKMDTDGGTASGKWFGPQQPGNKAGAKFGTGYCDAKCSRNVHFMKGMANSEGWQPSPYDPTAGEGNFGSCCAEVDIFEGNAFSHALTLHSSLGEFQTRCFQIQCGGPNDIITGPSDTLGCEMNPYRLGDKTFYGPSKQVNTNQKFTVVTQFVGSPIQQVKRFYIQNGQIIKPEHDIITSYDIGGYCSAAKSLFMEPNRFDELGGFQSITNAFQQDGMVLAMSIGIDRETNNLPLDGVFPPFTINYPGGERGPCPFGGPIPAVEPGVGDSSRVTFSDIRVGPIGSTT